MKNIVLALSLLAAPASPSCVAFAGDPRSIPLANSFLTEGAPTDACRAEKTGKAGGPVKWRVVRAATAGAGAAIAEVSRETTDPKYPICVFDGIKATDVEISVDITPMEGELDRAGGLVVRLVDANNYYVARANALEENVRLYHVVNGVRDQFAGVTEHVYSGKPQRLLLRVEDDLFTVEFNGKKLYEARDSTFKGPGLVALWSKADSLTEFSNLAVRVLKE
jgi:hypothetical protein